MQGSQETRSFKDLLCCHVDVPEGRVPVSTAPCIVVQWSQDVDVARHLVVCGSVYVQVEASCSWRLTASAVPK